MEPISYATMASPVGAILLAGNVAGLTLINFQAGSEPFEPPDEWKQYTPAILEQAIAQLEAYFEGRRKNFDVALNPAGTAFQRKVWSELRRIPHGKTISYGELARRIGNPKACRAVGAANGRNPISIIIPCHRVIGSNGNLTGYAGGVPLKKILLDLENAGSGQGSLFPQEEAQPHPLGAV